MMPVRKWSIWVVALRLEEGRRSSGWSLCRKRICVKDTFTANQFQQLFSDIPVEEVEAVKQVVDDAEASLGIELSPNIYLTLTDHIHYALVRAREGIELPNPLLFETRKFYPKEYAVAADAVAYFEKVFGISLPESEIGFIAFHIVNSEQANGTMETTMQARSFVTYWRSSVVFMDESLTQIPWTINGSPRIYSILRSAI